MIDHQPLGQLFVLIVFGLLVGCKEQTLTIDEVRKDQPSFKVWKEEIFHNDTGGIKVIHRFSEDSICKWTMTCFPSDSGCFITEYRGRTLLYMENKLDNGWVYIESIINDHTGKPPAYRSTSFYPSGQLETEGIEANVVGHPASNCNDPIAFKLFSDSILEYREGAFWTTDFWRVKTGTWKSYHANGELKLIEEFDTVYGQCVEVINGDPWVGISDSYSISTTAILNGYRTEFDQNGKAISKELWKKGRLIKEMNY